MRQQRCRCLWKYTRHCAYTRQHDKFVHSVLHVYTTTWQVCTLGISRIHDNMTSLYTRYCTYTRQHDKFVHSVLRVYTTTWQFCTSKTKSIEITLWNKIPYCIMQKWKSWQRRKNKNVKKRKVCKSWNNPDNDDERIIVVWILKEEGKWRNNYIRRETEEFVGFPEEGWTNNFKEA